MYRFTRVVLANYRRFGSFKNQLDFTPKFRKVEPQIKFLLGAGLLGFLEKKTDEEIAEKKESDLIMAIKRGVLCVQREEYQKAEQMFHLGKKFNLP